MQWKLFLFVVEENEYKLLGIKSVKMVEALKKLKMSLFVGVLKTLRDNSKILSNDDVLEEKLLKYVRLINKIVSKLTIKDEFNKFNYIYKGEKLRGRSIDPDIRAKFIPYCD